MVLASLTERALIVAALNHAAHRGPLLALAQTTRDRGAALGAAHIVHDIDAKHRARVLRLRRRLAREDQRQ